MRPQSLLDIVGLLRDAAIVEMVSYNVNREDTPWTEAAQKLHELEEVLQDIFGKGDMQ